MKIPWWQRFERNRDTVMTFADCSVRDIPAREKQALLLSYLPLLEEDPCITMPQGPVSGSWQPVPFPVQPGGGYHL